MLLGSARPNGTAAPEGLSKGKTSEREGSFSALMSLAIEAIFHGGQEATGTFIGQEAATGGEEISTSQAAKARIPFPAPASAGEQGIPSLISWERALKGVAGPVEDAGKVTETGGNAGDGISGEIGLQDKTCVALPAFLQSTPVSQDLGRATAWDEPAALVEAMRLTDVALTTEAAVAPAPNCGSFETPVPLDNSSSFASPFEAAEYAPLTGDGPRETLEANGTNEAAPAKMVEQRQSATASPAASNGLDEAMAPVKSIAEPETETRMTGERETAVDQPAASVRARRGAGEVEELKEVKKPEVTPGSVYGAQSAQKAVETEGTSPEREPLSLDNVRTVAETLYRESIKKLPRSVEFRMDPPELGSVTAVLSQRGQDVTVKFVAHTAEAQRVLSEGTHDLARALSEKGMALTGFSVDQGNSGSPDHGRRETGDKSYGGGYGRSMRQVAEVSGTPKVAKAGAFSWFA